ncbi:MAG: type 4a pilus biogenesis protein PilO, partial [Acinetobacter sp.]
MNLEKSDDLNQDTVVVKKKKMTLEQFFQQFNTLDMNNYGGWSLSVKITCWFFVFLAVVALGYFVVVKKQLDNIASAQAQEQSLLNEFKEKDSKLRNLQQYQTQLQEMEANFNQQLEQLPKETEIPGLVEDINVSGVNSGLKFKNILLENEISSFSDICFIDLI